MVPISADMAAPTRPASMKPGEHRPQLTKHGNGHDRAHGGVHAEAMKLKIGLRGKNGAGETAGDQHHQLRAVADLEELVEEKLPADGSGEDGAEGIDRQQDQLAQVGAKAEEILADQAK